MASKPGSVSDGMPQLSAARKARIDAFVPYVSVLPWFNADVLHKLYLNVFKEKHPDATIKTQDHTEYDLRTITCADFLQSPQVKRIDYNVFVVEDDLREPLRNEMKEDRGVMKKLGEFMLAYADQCRGHFLSTRYVEVYRIEGNLIVNPAAEAGRIAQHVAQQLNNKRDLSKMEPSVAYFLNMLDQDDQALGNEELRTFLKGMDSYLNKNKEDAAREWEKLQGKEEGGDSIAIRLPAEVRKTILDNIQQARPQVQKSVGGRRLFAVIVGIDEYEGDVPRLNSCVKDAKEMDHLLRELAREQGTMEYHPLLLLSLEATRESVKDAFFHFKAARADRGDVCLFYFAGHGAQELAAPGLKADGKYSTLICADSRGEGGFDLLDVELSYLLYKATFEAHEQATTENELHTLVILDCSHSGGFTRGYTDKIPRQTAQPQATRALESVLGFNDANKLQKAATLATYIEELRKWQSLPLVSLVATQADQVALELTVEGENVGLFTWSLLQELREKNGTKKTYPELLERLKQSISERNDKQVPVLNITAPSTGDQQFMGGIFNPIDKKAPSQKARIYFNESTGFELLLEKVKDRTSPKNNYEFTENEATADFIISPLNDRVTIRAQKTSELIVALEIDDDVTELLEKLVMVGNWQQIREIRNPDTKIDKNYFDVQVETFEDFIGYDFEIERVKGKIQTNPKEVELSYQYVDEKQFNPVCKLRLKAHNGPYYFAAVLVENSCGIVSLRSTTKIGEGEELSLVVRGDDEAYADFLNLILRDEYLAAGITSITDYLKIIVAREPFSIDSWLQPNPSSDTKDRRKLQSYSSTREIDPRSIFKDEDNWTAITIPITTTRSLPKQETTVPSPWQPLPAYTAPVLSVAYSPDGQLALTGCLGGTVKLWEEASGYCVLYVNGHTDNVNSVAFSPVSPLFVTASKDNNVKLWAIHSGECLKTFTGHTGPVLSVAFSPDGNLLATGSKDRTHKIWSIDGELLNSVEHPTAISCVVFSEDGRSVFTGREDADDESTGSQNIS